MKTFTRLVFVIAAFVFPVLNVDAAWSKEALKDNFKNIHSKTPLAIQQEAATDVIARLLPDHWNLFQIQLTSELPVNSFQLLKRDNDTVVRIMASSGVAACKGFHHYFKNYLGGHTSWSGNRIPTIPKVLPSIDMHSSSASLFIYHQNVCTWSYSYAWWKWPDWQKHIDWMAFMGISLTLAPIQEEIWTRVYRNIGLTDNEIDAHFAGPGFQAWQRMGNMRGWVGPLSSTYKRQQLELQKKIIKAQQNLGMSVAMAAFAGHVPVAFRRLYPNTTLTPVECWNNFPEDYCCPLFIDPEQDIFGTIGSAFLREAIKEYGTDHIYFSDPFNEINPHSNDPAYLAKTSQNIYNAMKNVDPEAIWLLQGWMFINSELFWKQELIKAFLTAVPLGRILVLDLQSELAPQYERTNSYYGQPFIWCMLHNFGGTLGMHGSAEIVNTRIALTRNMTNSTMIGVGITMEGINQNYVMYEFALDRGWWFVNFDEKDWFDMFSASRYGMAETNVTKTNDLLRASVYAYRGLEKLHGKYTICGRPSIKLKPWSWYDHNVLESAWTSLLYANHLHKSALYRHDLVDITRQFLQIKADEIYVNIIEAYAAKKLNSTTRTQ